MTSFHLPCADVFLEQRGQSSLKVERAEGADVVGVLHQRQFRLWVSSKRIAVRREPNGGALIGFNRGTRRGLRYRFGRAAYERERRDCDEEPTPSCDTPTPRTHRFLLLAEIGHAVPRSFWTTMTVSPRFSRVGGCDPQARGKKTSLRGGHIHGDLGATGQE